MKKPDEHSPEIVAVLLSIGDLLDEILCQLRGTPVDEKHQTFGKRLKIHLDQFHKPQEEVGPSGASRRK